ncbi:MAG: hypothetical protein ACREO3_08720 [Arenimonas sp.]
MTGPTESISTGRAPGALSAWLAPALLDWLQAKGCTGVGLAADDDDDDRVAWRDSPVTGWRVPLGDGRGSGVILAFARPDLLDAIELGDVAALFARLHAFPLAHDAGGAVLVDHAEVRRLIHDLRNGLNTLLINASVLTRAAQREPALARSVEFIEHAGVSCAAQLDRLSELTARPQGRV